MTEMRALVFGLALLLAQPIGFRVIEATDVSRVSARFPSGRPIQISLWYPAAGPGQAMAYRDYVGLRAGETLAGTPSGPQVQAAEKEYKELLGSAGVTAEHAEAFLATRMQAGRDAAPARGKMPVVLIAQGNDGSVHDQAFLAERLAAHGYVVATVPSQSRMDGPMKSEQEIPGQAEDQGADLAFALQTLRSDPSASLVGTGPYAVIGYSFGARGALLLAMRDPKVAAVVSLDGGIGGRAGKGFLEKAPGFDRRRAVAPLLHLFEEGDRFMVPDLELLRSLDRADRWLVRVDGMRHVHFSSLGIAVRSLKPLAEKTAADDRTRDAWDAVAAATTAFLDHSLRSTAPASEWAPPVSELLHTEHLPPGPK
jgi:dienelactone hydrolase